jgi:hypothetical protein
MGRDIAIGRKGDQLTGECLTETFTMETSFGQLTFKKKEIRRIELRSPNGLRHDEITRKNGDRSVGRLLTATVVFKSDDVTHDIPTTALIALLLNWGFDEAAPSLI